MPRRAPTIYSSSPSPYPKSYPKYPKWRGGHAHGAVPTSRVSGQSWPMCASPVAEAVLLARRYTFAVREQESHDTSAQAPDCLNGTISVGAVSLICKRCLPGSRAATSRSMESPPRPESNRPIGDVRSSAADVTAYEAALMKASRICLILLSCSMRCSGCHCTASTKRFSGASSSSMTPSGAAAAAIRPGATSATAWW